MTLDSSQRLAEDLLRLRDCTPPIVGISPEPPASKILDQSEGGVNPNRKRSFWSSATNPVTLPVLVPEVRIPTNAYHSTKNTQMCPYCPQLFQQWQHFGETVVLIHCLDKHAEQVYELSQTTTTKVEKPTSSFKSLNLFPTKRTPAKSVRFQLNTDPKRMSKSGGMRPSEIH
jgi:hypothetical protein